MYIQSVYPRLDLETNPGWCLKFVQDSFRAPVMHATATIAADATQFRNTSRTMPDVAVPVWFWHYGIYNDVPGEYGHVVIWVPGRGFLSSPVTGFGSLWLSSIEDVERTFYAKYRFWTQDINTLRVVEPTPVKEKDPMPIQTSTPSYNSNQEIPPGKWSYLHLNDKKWITFIQGGSKVKSGTAYTNLATTGDVLVKYVQDETDKSGSKVLKSGSSVWSRISDIGIHAWPIQVKKGSQYRYRVMAKPVGDKPVKITSIRTITDYWEK